MNKKELEQYYQELREQLVEVSEGDDKEKRAEIWEKYKEVQKKLMADREGIPAEYRSNDIEIRVLK